VALDSDAEPADTTYMRYWLLVFAVGAFVGGAAFAFEGEGVAVGFVVGGLAAILGESSWRWGARRLPRSASDRQRDHAGYFGWELWRAAGLAVFLLVLSIYFLATDEGGLALAMLAFGAILLLLVLHWERKLRSVQDDAAQNRPRTPKDALDR
jgi:hypothetical protein